MGQVLFIQNLELNNLKINAPAPVPDPSQPNNEATIPGVCINDEAKMMGITPAVEKDDV